MEDNFSSLSAPEFGVGTWSDDTKNNSGGLCTARPHPAGLSESLIPADHLFHHRPASHAVTSLKDVTLNVTHIAITGNGEARLKTGDAQGAQGSPEVLIPPPPPLPPPSPPLPPDISHRKDPPGGTSPITISKEVEPPVGFDYPRVELSRRQGCHVTTIYVPPPEDSDPRLPVLDGLSGPIPPHFRYSRTPSLTPLSSLAPVAPRSTREGTTGAEDQHPKIPGSDSPRVYVRSYKQKVPEPDPEPRKSVSIGGNWTLTERHGAPDGMPDGMPAEEAPHAYINHSFDSSEVTRVGEVKEATEVAVNIEDDVAYLPATTKKEEISNGREKKQEGEKVKEENEKEKEKGMSNGGSLAIQPAVEQLDEEAKWLQWMEAKFTDIAGEDGEIDLPEFKKALGVKKSFFAERFFALFDSDGSGSIEMVELMDGLKMLTKGTPKEKLKFLFDVYDVDGGGTIDFDELKTVLKSCMDESSLQLTEDSLDRLTAALFDSADEDGSGAITFEELVEELEKFPGVLDNLTISAANWLKPPEEKKKKRFTRPRYFTKRYIMNNMKKVIFFFVYWFLNIGLFALNAYRYWDNNVYVIIARGAGMCLNFNGMFIVVLMLRACLTWLRTTRIGPFLPLDQSVMFHKMVGLSIAFFTFIHTVAHLVNIAVVMEEGRQVNSTIPIHLQKLQYWEFLFTLRSQIGWIGPGFGYLSGVILDVILFIMVICSMPFIRRGGHFQVFYWTHMLYIPFWVLLIMHGPIFWYFFVIPGFLFILERINVSKFYKLARFGHVKVKEVNLLPSRVTNLVIARPTKFRYKPGDYIFVNIPVIAQYEWHPFTISSAPELETEVWLHVRSVGHWTNKLYDYFDTQPDVHENGNLNGIEINGGDKKPTPKKSNHKKKMVNVEIYIDGPYGTSTREIFDSDHAVLIASGIGVTPYASILQSVHKRYMAYRKNCPKCDHEWYGDVPPHVMKLKKVDFIWINRDQKCFEWFCELLSRLEVNSQEADATTEEEVEGSRFISMHMYITSALGKTDMKGIGLQMAMEILHKKEGRDLITGLRCRTQAGRPNWRELFAQINARKKGKVNVFFCGSPQLAKSLKEHSEEIGFNFNKENF